MATPAQRTNTWILDQWYDQSVAGTTGGYNAPGDPPYLYAWGSNSYGLFANSGLPVGSGTKRSSPLQLSGTTGFTKLHYSYGYAAFGVKTAGTLYTWGQNGFYGRLGLNDNANRSSPTQLPGTNWVKAQGGAYGTLANKSDGTLWAWGYNNVGQLGDNDGFASSSPKQIPGAWSTSEYGIGTSGEARFALKSNNTLWAWGKNNFGGLGLNDKTQRSSPTQIPGTTWAAIDMTYSSNEGSAAAVKTDGTAWIWGWNDSGALGLNQAATTKYSSPVQLPGTTWSRIQISGSDHILGVKTNGTIWGWGANWGGNLGLNDAIQRSSPTQVGTDTTWTKAQLATNASYGMKTDGTLWGWGQNGGTLAQNNQTKYSSPVQIPGTWTDYGLAGQCVFGIK